MASPPSVKDPGIGRLSGEFREPGLEEQFRLATVREWVQRLVMVAMFGGSFYLVGFWVDYGILGLNQISLRLLTIRVLFAVLTFYLAWLIRRLKRPHVVDYLALTVLLACVGGTLFIIQQTVVPSIRHALTVFVFVIIFFLFVPTRVWINALSAGMLSAGFLIIAWFNQTPYAVMTLIVLYVVLGNLLGWRAAVHLHVLRRRQWFNLQAERRAQAKLLEEVKERKLAEETLRYLASGVAHNFNNSLMAIISNLQAAQGVLQNGGELSAAQAFLSNAWQGAASGREVAQRLTRAVVGEAGSQKDSGLMELGELIRQAQSIAQLTWARKDQRLEFREEIEPQLWVMAKRGELMEIFLNIFKNSLEALTLGGRIMVRAGRQGERVMVEVQDNGPGITLEMQRRLFKPFTSDKGVRGQGLGLAVSRGILRGLNGDITCRSQPGQGTTMVIGLPVAPAGASPPPDPVPPVLPSRPQNKRVLLVEDEALVALGVSAILRQEGHQVWQAKDLAEAERKLSDARPDLVVCDFGLPDGNALNIHQAVRDWAEVNGRPEPAFIILTGWSKAQLAGQAASFSVEPFAWLQKPVGKQELLDLMQKAAGGGNPRPRLTSSK